MSFNLIRDEWMPVIRQDGTKEVIAPYQLTENLSINPIVAFNAPRSDFNGSLIQFAIGLVQTTMAPKDKGEWRRGFTSPPSKEKLKTIFDTASQNFDFDGDEACFMQDYELRDGNVFQIDKVLMEMPGKNTIENNTDHFLKRDTVKRMCFSCCATAFFSLQINAPSGGQGNRTSLRGGGPVTTIVTADDNIWHTIWLNVLPEEEFKRLGNFSKTEPRDIFPWMGPTRTSEKQQETTSHDVHPYHMFWSMPRRIRINFDKIESGSCDICGNNKEKLVTTYRSKNYGTNYGGAWIHPLSPYTQTKKGDFFQGMANLEGSLIVTG
ncbi:MAG: type I-E CRISPR-associated protein Cse1/CasA [Methanosarcina barkeri]|nr:type I-E CRISPR-associated protein Cse1/CasA [Methanosarcina sp. ERenArc_MAG2]